LENKKSPWNPLLDSLASKYIRREWGWEGKLLSNEETWGVEVAMCGAEACQEQFPSYWARSKFAKKQIYGFRRAPPDGEQRRVDPPHSLLADLGSDPTVQDLTEWIRLCPMNTLREVMANEESKDRVLKLMGQIPMGKASYSLYGKLREAQSLCKRAPPSATAVKMEPTLTQ